MWQGIPIAAYLPGRPRLRATSVALLLLLALPILLIHIAEVQAEAQTVRYQPLADELVPSAVRCRGALRNKAWPQWQSIAISAPAQAAGCAHMHGFAAAHPECQHHIQRHPRYTVHLKTAVHVPPASRIATALSTSAGMPLCLDPRMVATSVNFSLCSSCERVELIKPLCVDTP